MRTYDLSNLKTVEFGTTALPYPASHDGGQTMRVYADDANPLRITTCLDPKKVLALLYTTSMATPSFLPFVEEALSLRHISDPRRHGTPHKGVSLIQVVRGGPGIGKSYTAKMFPRLRHPMGGLVFHAAGVDAGQSIWKTILEPQTAKPLIHQINDRMATGIDVLVVDQLNKLFGSEKNGNAILKHEHGDRARIDWDAINQSLDPKRYLDFIQLAPQLLGLKRDNVAGFRMVDIPGAFTQAWFGSPETGGVPTEILFDELDKAQPGTVTNLNGLFETLGFAPHATKFTKTSNDGQTVTFDLAERHPLFFATCAMNHLSDGSASNDFNASTWTRLPVYDVPEQTEHDLAHMAAIALCGFPLTTYVGATDSFSHWTQNPKTLSRRMDQFNDWLGTPLSREDADFRAPEAWPHVMEAAKTLGGYFHELFSSMDPQSSLRRAMPPDDKGKWSPANTALAKRLALGPRFMTRLIEQAKYTRRPKILSTFQSDKLPAPGNSLPEPKIEEEIIPCSFTDMLGRNISDEVHYWIERVAREESKLEDPLRHLAQKKRIVPREPRRLDDKNVYIAETLGTFATNDAITRRGRNLVELFRRVLHILNQDKDINVIPALPLKRANALYDAFEGQSDGVSHSFGQGFLVFNPNIAEFVAQPLVACGVSNKLFDEATHQPESSISTLSFVTAMITPIDTYNMSRLWLSDFANAIHPQFAGDAETLCATGRNPNCQTSLVLVNHQGKPTSISVIRSQDKTLLVGPDLSAPPMNDFLHSVSAQMVYINRDGADASQKLKKWFHDHALDTTGVAARALALRLADTHGLVMDPEKAITASLTPGVCVQINSPNGPC